ncbi:MAG: c-type cytochrome [Rhizobiaceae bacterium]
MKSFGKISMAVIGLAGIGVMSVPTLDAYADSHGMSPAEMVEKRQGLMKTMGKSFGPIIPVIKGESQDLEAAGAAAMAMNQAIVDSLELYIEGTAAGEVPGSRAKAEVWAKSDEFKKAADDLIAASAALAEAAKTGDVDQFKAAFQPLGAACGGCHEGKGNLGGKFRTPKES